jgi:hypothetical protein
MTKTGRPKQRIEVKPNKDIVIIGVAFGFKGTKKPNFLSVTIKERKFSTYRRGMRRNTGQ